MSVPGPPERREDDGASGSRWRRLERRSLPRRVRRSYALKFALALLLVVLLLVGIGAASYVQIQGIVENDAETTLRSAAEIQSDVVVEWYVGLERQTSGVADASVYGTRSPDRIREHLRDATRTGGSDVSEAHYVVNGEVVASTTRSLEGEEVDDAAPELSGTVRRAERRSDEVVGTDRAYERNGRLSLAFARQVRVGDGVVVLEADVRRGLERLDWAESMAATRVLTADGRELRAPAHAEPLAVHDTAGFEAARDGETTVVEHEDHVVAFAPVEGIDWIVAAEAPASEVYQASDTAGRNVAVLIGAALLTLGLVAVAMGRGTVVPLIRLRKRARELESGNFDVDLSSYREDEIGRLFDAFAQMRDALREQIRETEAARERAEASRRELERQNERLDQFASTVSHDLRNPLAVADGHRQMLADQLASQEDPAVEVLEEHVQEIGTSHERIQAIVDDVLRLAREGQTIEDLESVDLESIVRRAWGNVDHGDAALTVTGTRTLEADSERLLRVFENLFRNSLEHGSTSPGSEARQDAVEHGTTSPGSEAHQDAVEQRAPDGADVTAPGGSGAEPVDGSDHGASTRSDAVASGRVNGGASAVASGDGGRPQTPPVTVEVGPTETGFYVADDGPGLPEDALDDVFEYGATTESDGTGFGLAIVEAIVTAHGWSIAPGESSTGGAKFTVDVRSDARPAEADADQSDDSGASDGPADQQ